MPASIEIVWSGNDRARRISSSSFCHSWSSFMSSRSNARSATNLPVNTRTSLLRLRFVHRDRVDAHPQSREFQAEPDGRSSRRFLREEFPVRLVHRREVSGIREEDRRPDDGTEAQVQFFQDRLYVPQALARLPPDVRSGPFARLRPGAQRRLSRDEDEAVGDDAMGIRPDRLRMVGQFRDSLHDPPPRECRGAQKDCDPRRALGGEPDSKTGPRNAPELPVLSMQEYKKLGRSARRKSDGPQEPSEVECRDVETRPSLTRRR